MHTEPTRRHDSPLLLHPLAFLEEDGEVVIGRPDVDSFGVFPKEGAALLRRLVDGQPPSAAAAWYADTYNEEVDMSGFLATLDDLRFLRPAGQPPVEPPPVRWQRLGRALFSAPAWIVYAAVVALGAVACATTPAVRPSPGNVVFSDYLLVVAATVVAGQLCLTAFHELFHVLAARRLGVRSSVRVSRRFYFVVFETNLDGLVVLPRRQRILPVLAGLLADSVAFSALTVTASLCLASHREVAEVCLALAFTTLPRMAWQFYVFLRTDIYYLVTILTGAADLDAAGRAHLANVVGRLARGRGGQDLSGFHRRDVRAARWFAPLLVVGYAAMSAMLLLTLPVLWQLLASSAERMLASPPAHPGDVLDAALFGALVIGQLAFAAIHATRRRVARRKDPE